VVVAVFHFEYALHKDGLVVVVVVTEIKFSVESSMTAVIVTEKGQGATKHFIENEPTSRWVSNALVDYDKLVVCAETFKIAAVLAAAVGEGSRVIPGQRDSCGIGTSNEGGSGSEDGEELHLEKSSEAG